MIIYAACNAIGQFSTLVLSIDAPLRMLLDNEDAEKYKAAYNELKNRLLVSDKYITEGG